MPVALAKQLIRDDKGVREEKMTAKAVADQMHYVKRVDLNGDGKPEFIFSGIVCGNANCGTWIYRKNGKRYVQIPFNASTIGIEIRKTKTNGYFDITVETHGSAAETGLLIYKFDGSKDESKNASAKNLLLTQKHAKKRCLKLQR